MAKADRTFRYMTGSVIAALRVELAVYGLQMPGNEGKDVPMNNLLVSWHIDPAHDTLWVQLVSTGWISALKVIPYLNGIKERIEKYAPQDGSIPPH